MSFRWEEEPGVPRRCKLYWNEEFLKRASHTIVSQSDLRLLEGVSSQLQEKIFSLEVKGGTRYALFLLGKRAMHSAQLTRSLKRHFLSNEAIAEVISYCVDRGYLLDNEWVERKVSSWISSGKSRHEIVARLRRDGVFTETPHIDDAQALASLIERKYPDLLDSRCSYEKKGKAIRAILRRGFSFDSIQNFLQNK